MKLYVRPITDPSLTVGQYYLRVLVILAGTVLIYWLAYMHGEVNGQREATKEIFDSMQPLPSPIPNPPSFRF